VGVLGPRPALMRRLPWEGGGSATARAALLFGAIVLVTGVRFADLSQLVALHAQPFRLLDSPQKWFLHGSLLNIFAGHALHVESPLQIRGFYLAATFLAIGAILYYGHRGLADPGERWRFFVLVALSPLLHVLVFWVGKSDAFLVAGYFLLLLARGPLVVGALALGMTLAHQEIATVLLAVHALLHRPRPALLLALVAGWAAGLGVHQVYLAQLGITGSSRVLWAAGRLEAFARSNFARPVAMLALSFSWFWIPVLVFLRERRGWAVPGLAAGCFAVATFGVDFTRVFTVMALPLIVHVARELARAEGGVLQPHFRAFTLLAFVQMELAIGRVWDNGWALMLVRALGIRPGGL
jgi:hypothetical protein